GGIGIQFVHNYPETAPPNYGFFTNVLADSQSGPIGWDIQSAHSIVLANSWAATSQRYGIYADRVVGLGIHHSRIYWNGEEGIYLTDNARDVIISDSRITGNSKSASGSFPGIYVNSGAKNVMIRGNMIGAADGFGNTQSYGITVSPGPIAGLMIQGNMF